MLEYVSESEHSSAIRWTKNGKAFIIIQKDIIVEHVLPMFVHQTKFTSFVSSSCILASVLTTYLWLLKFEHGYDSNFDFDMPTHQNFNRLVSSICGVFTVLSVQGKMYGSIRTSFGVVSMASSTF